MVSDLDLNLLAHEIAAKKGITKMSLNLSSNSEVQTTGLGEVIGALQNLNKLTELHLILKKIPKLVDRGLTPLIEAIN